ncbi:hypothetical protein ID866_4453 [Astraeus odoratus]|nr:hypothetical protein ID866_4453 [Astraeus odoratus]
MFLSKCMFSFILLTGLSILNPLPTHLGAARMLFARDQKHTNALSIDLLGKRDGTLIVQLEYGYYCATVITSSGTRYRVIADTGSAYTWVGAIADNPYLNGFASRATGVTTDIGYAGNTITFEGETYNDTIALGGLIIKPQGIGVPTKVEGFPANIDGVLGLGPTRMTVGVASDGKLIPTVVDNLYDQGAISSPSLGIFFMPKNVGTSGLLSFGQIRETVLTSDVKYVPVTMTYPSKMFWGIDASIMYGDNIRLLTSGSGILDTGADWITIASDAFSVYKSATGASLYGGRLVLAQALYSQLQPLSILIGGESYKLSPNAQIRARSSPNSHIILVVRGRLPGSAIDFSLGAPFFQRYYVVLNSATNEIGFASHIHTDSTTN